MYYGVRPMELWDIAQVSKIEREAFPPPWPATNFKRELTANSLTRYLVALKHSSFAYKHGENKIEKSRLDTLKSGFTRLFGTIQGEKNTDDEILGFAGVWFSVDEAHLSNIAVHDDFKGKGVGERLLIAVIDLAVSMNSRFVTLEVRTSNEAAKCLYRKYDFIEVGLRPGYYMDNKEDALLMTVDMIHSPEYQYRLAERKRSFSLKWGVHV